MNVNPSASYEAVIDTGETGLVGTIGTRVNDNLGATTTAFSSANIQEIAAGIYAASSRTAPGTAGQYTLIWTNGSAGEVLGVEDLLVTGDAIPAVPGTNLYVTRDELKAWVDVDGTWVDDEADEVCETASRAIDGIMDTRFYPTTETRYYTSLDGYDDYISIEDVISVTAVDVDTDGNGSYDTNWVENTDFYLDPPNAALVGRPSRRLVLRSQAGRVFPSYARAIRVTGSFGWAETPPAVRTAAKILAARLLKRRETPNAIVTVGSDVAAAMRLGKFDPDVMSLLDTLPGRRKVLFV